MIAIKNGHRYLIIYLNTTFLLNGAPFLVISSPILSIVMTLMMELFQKGETDQKVEKMSGLLMLKLEE